VELFGNTAPPVVGGSPTQTFFLIAIIASKIYWFLWSSKDISEDAITCGFIEHWQSNNSPVNTTGCP
jgi:hypothetical protein